MSGNIPDEGPWYITKIVDTGAGKAKIYLSGNAGDGAVGSTCSDVQWKLHEVDGNLTISRHVKGELGVYRLVLGFSGGLGFSGILIKSDDSTRAHPESRLWTLEDIKPRSVPTDSFVFTARIQSVGNPDLSIVPDNYHIKDPNVIAMPKGVITGKPPGFQIWGFERARDEVPESED